MKKAMIMVLMALMTMGVYAQDIRLKSGDVAPIMQKDKTATLDLDFSKAKLADLSKKELSDTKKNAMSSSWIAGTMQKVSAR